MCNSYHPCILIKTLIDEFPCNQKHTQKRFITEYGVSILLKVMHSLLLLRTYQKLTKSWTWVLNWDSGEKIMTSILLQSGAFTNKMIVLKHQKSQMPCFCVARPHLQNGCHPNKARNTSARLAAMVRRMGFQGVCWAPEKGRAQFSLRIWRNCATKAAQHTPTQSLLRWGVFWSPLSGASNLWKTPTEPYS